MSAFRKFWVYVVLLGLISVMLSYFGTRYALNWALTREAHSRGMDWAYHIEKKLPHVEGVSMGDGRIDPTGLPNVDELRTLLWDVFAVGHIYQFDYVNVDCLCHVSVVADYAHRSGVHNHYHLDPDHNHDVGANAGHDHGHEDVQGHDHGHDHGHGQKLAALDDAPSETPEVEAYPIDRDFVRQIVQAREDAIFLRTSEDAQTPATYAAVYHPVNAGENVLYLLRVLVNLEEQATRYNQFLMIATLFSFLILLVAMAYPTRWYVLSAKRQRSADQRAKFLANHDILTNLHNRNNFQEQVADILWSTHEAGQSALLFIFDLNGFKQVNDYFGHQVGDRLLCAFADLLREHAPEGAYMARLGGDEFVVLIGGLESVPQDFRVHLDMPKAVSLYLDGGERRVEATIAGGVARFPQDARTASELVQLADLALYEAKPNRLGDVHAYEPRMKKDFHDRLKMRQDFSEALTRGQIEPFYQPIVNMRTGAVEGFEALARWRHPERGVLTPHVFGELFEDNEISVSLGELMLDRIVADMARWTATDVPFESIGLNVATGDLKRASFASDVLDKLATHALSPRKLAIEVTENCFFGAEKPMFLKHLSILREAGCYVALDDFGTGYSSITQLKELPFTAVKIDKSFVKNILDDETDEAIVTALKDLGQTMKFKLVLEGIETQEQAAFLSQMGFELAQGYFFGRPMPAGDVPGYIAQTGAEVGRGGAPGAKQGRGPGAGPGADPDAPLGARSA